MWGGIYWWMDGCLYLFTFTCAQYAHQLMLCAVLLRSRRFHDFTLHVSFIYIKKLFELHHRYHNAIIFIPVRISLAQYKSVFELCNWTSYFTTLSSTYSSHSFNICIVIVYRGNSCSQKELQKELEYCSDDEGEEDKFGDWEDVMDELNQSKLSV